MLKKHFFHKKSYCTTVQYSIMDVKKRIRQFLESSRDKLQQYKSFINKAANADHYPRALGPILGYDSKTTTIKSHVDSAALRGSRLKMISFHNVRNEFCQKKTRIITICGTSYVVVASSFANRKVIAKLFPQDLNERKEKRRCIG